MRFPAQIDSDIEDVARALSTWSGVTQQPEPKNKRGVRTRAHLLGSARQAFIRKGYVECAVEDILQEAEISRGTFYAHFKSKKAVFAAVIEKSLETRFTSTDISDLHLITVRDRIEASVRRFLDAYSKSSDLSLVIDQAAHYDPEFRKIRLLIRDSFARRIARGIRRQQARGIADPECDPAAAALAIVSMMTNFAQMEIGWRGHRPNEDMVEILTRFWIAGVGLDETAAAENSDEGERRLA